MLSDMVKPLRVSGYSLNVLYSRGKYVELLTTDLRKAIPRITLKPI